MVSKPDPLDELIAEIGRSTDPETLAWLAGEVERWSKRARGLERVEDLFRPDRAGGRGTVRRAW